MKRPPIRFYLVGNAFVALPLCIIATLVVIQWLMGQTPIGWMLVWAGLATYAIRANDRLRHYWAWKREWDDMGGEGRISLFKLPRLPRTRTGWGILAWCMLALFALLEGGDRSMAWFVLLFWLTSIAMAFVLIRRRMRTGSFSASGAGGGGRNSDREVRVLVRVAGGSPGIRDCYGALPGYCTHLLRN